MTPKHPATNRTLDQYFATYREQLGVVSPEEARELLDRPVVRHTTSRIRKTQRTIMSISVLIASVAVLWKLFLPGNGTVIKPVSLASASSIATSVADATHSSSPTSASKVNELHSLPSNPALVTVPDKPVVDKPAQPTNPIGIIELPDPTLAKLGISPAEPGKVALFVNQGRGKIGKVTIRPTNIGATQVEQSEVPGSVSIAGIYPVFVTSGDGHKSFYRYWQDTTKGKSSYSVQSVDNIATLKYRHWLDTAEKVPGVAYFCISGMQSTNNEGVRHDSVVVMVGRDLPKALRSVDSAVELNEYPPEVKRFFVDYERHLEGKGSMPSQTNLPKWISFGADTTSYEVVTQMLDAGMQSGLIHDAREASNNLDRLVPIAVHTSVDRNDLATNGYIFWYEPSQELMASLPQQIRSVVESRIKKELASAIAVASTTGRPVVYSINCDSIGLVIPGEGTRNMTVSINDLTGRVLFSQLVSAYGNETNSRVDVGTMEPGIYLVTIDQLGQARIVKRILMTGAASKNPVASNRRIGKLAVDSSVATHFVELSTGDAGRLGLETVEDPLLAGVRYYTNSGSEASTMNVLRSWGVVMKDFPMSAVPKSIVPANFEPTFVTDGLGRKRLTSYTITPITPDIEKELESKIDSMIPILFRAPGSNQLGATDLVFWYLPTPELLAQLSDSVKLAMGTIDSLAKDHDFNPTLAVAMTRGSIHGATIYPNPSRGAFSVRVELAEARSLDFTLRDLTGREVQRLSNVASAAAGNSTVKLDATAIPEGVYLLDVSTDHNEHYITRVVILR